MRFKSDLIKTIMLGIFLVSLVIKSEAQMDMSSFSSSEDDSESESASREDSQEASNRKDRQIPPQGQLPSENGKCIVKQFPKIEQPFEYSYLVCSNFTLNFDQKLANPGVKILKYVVFENSAFSTLPSGFFTNFENVSQLTQVYLNNCRINEIQEGAFLGLGAAEDLYLQDNNIVNLSRGTFSNLTRLKSLDLTANNLAAVTGNAFAELESLQKINLGSNKLKELPPAVFKHSVVLNHVNISQNALSKLPTGLPSSIVSLDVSFDSLTELDFSALPESIEHLHINNNKVVRLKNMATMTQLTVLDLSNNYLVNISSFPNKLKYLSLHRNQIKVIDDSAFNQSYNLIFLDVSYNCVENITKNTLARAGQLKVINMQNNQLKTLPAGGFLSQKWLIKLNLSSNQLTEWKVGFWNGLYNLEQLDLSNNKITDLYEVYFNLLKSLKYLNLSGNRLVKLNPNPLINLETVVLDRNLWFCNSLFDIMAVLTEAGVNVPKGGVTNLNNIDGIACSDYHVDLKSTNLSDVLTQIQTIPYQFEQDAKNIQNSIDAQNLVILNLTNQLVSLQNDFKNHSSSNLPSYKESQEVLLKISQLQNGIVIIVVAILAIVISILLFIVLRKIGKSLTQNMNKPVYRKTSSDSIAAMELI